MKKAYKTIFKKEDYKINLIKIISSSGKFIEYNLEGKQKIAITDKWDLDFKARCMVEKSTGRLGYIVVEYFKDPSSGKQYREPFGYIANTDEEFIKKTPRMKQEYLDIVAAAVLEQKMLGN